MSFATRSRFFLSALAMRASDRSAELPAPLQRGEALLGLSAVRGDVRL
jgi:hypothetical protein